MKQLFFCLCLCFCGLSTAYSQKISLECYGGLTYDYIPAFKSEFEQNYQTVIYLTDSTGLSGTRLSRYHQREDYSSIFPGYQVGLRTVVSLDNRTDIITGFGLAYHSFTRTVERDEYFFSISSTNDTIYFSGVSGNGPAYTYVYDNDYLSLNINSTPTFSVLHLAIPFEIRHAFTKRLKARAGITLSTPVNSNIHRESVITNEETTGTVIHLRFEKTELNDRTGAAFRDLTYALSGGIDYQWSKHIAIGLAFQKAMKSIIQPYSNFDYFPQDRTYQALPVSLSALLTYRL